MAYIIEDFKVSVLPSIGVPNSRYYLKVGSVIKEYITDLAGNFLLVSGGGAGSYLEINEALIGTIDGSNATFTTSQNFVAGTTIVFVNGLKQKIVDHYNTSGTNTILFNDSPLTGDLLEINYVKL